MRPETSGPTVRRKARRRRDRPHQRVPPGPPPATALPPLDRTSHVGAACQLRACHHPTPLTRAAANASALRRIHPSPHGGRSGSLALLSQNFPSAPPVFELTSRLMSGSGMPCF